MSTYRELIYFCLDAIKAYSDDAIVTEEHVRFLLDKYRSYLLKQKYEKDPRRQVPDSNYQTIVLDMAQWGKLDETTWSNHSQISKNKESIQKEDDLHFGSLEGADMQDLKKYEGYPDKETRWNDDNLVKRTYLRSVQEIPNTMQLGISSCYIVDPFQATITIISKERLEFVGWNKFLKKIIYGAIGPDQRLYLKSENPEFPAIQKVVFRAVFEDVSSALEDEDSETFLNENFPLEEALIGPMLKMVIADLLGIVYRPADPLNNADDDMASISQFIRQNMKDRYAKQYLDGANSGESE